MVIFSEHEFFTDRNVRKNVKKICREIKKIGGSEGDRI